MQENYTVTEVCRKLNKSRSTVYRYLKQNKIKKIKYKGQYQISKTELQKFITETPKRNIIDKATQFISMKNLRKNFSYYQIKKMVEEKKLRKINKRYYENLEFDEWEQHTHRIDELNYYQIDVYIPNGVVCLYSAAVFYNLTTHVPWTVEVAIPRNQRVCKLPDRPSMTPFYFSKKRYKLGLINKKSKNGFYRIYDLEKTICDFIAYRKKIDAFTYKEVINNYIRHPNRNLKKLHEYAKQLKVEAILNIYLEVLPLSL